MTWLLPKTKVAPFLEQAFPSADAEKSRKIAPSSDEALRAAVEAHNKCAPETPTQPAPEPLARPFSQRIRARLHEIPAAVKAVDQIWAAIHVQPSAASCSKAAEPAEDDLLDYDRYMRMHFAIQRSLLPTWGVSEAAQRAKRDWECDRQGAKGVARSRFRDSILHIASTRARGGLQNPTDAELTTIALRATVFLWHLLHAITVVEQSGQRRLRRMHESVQGALVGLSLEQLQVEAEELMANPSCEEMVHAVDAQQQQQTAAMEEEEAQAPHQQAAPGPVRNRQAPRGPPAPPLQRDLAWLAAVNRIKHRADPFSRA
eukprot:tig00001041_g6545.t1